MGLDRLSPAPGSTQTKKRLGRGPGSGTGGTAGRGEKGYYSRSGSVHQRGFEGGQMPLYRRLPKRGFTNVWAEGNEVVNLRDLKKLADTTVTPETLKAAGLIRYSDSAVKILGMGDADRAYEVSLCTVSESAGKKIAAAGGKVVSA
ncbi:MAG: 50S ribosomal protein L15 [Calditrichaeota bacterium]|nr:50S ribosomal protein L15 [Calditrichota bacterium]MCB9366231.1 50S ribosomal protein L15 [Calditrichota bacterium]MCB9391700.1 50S ribosomal protein L15 [Calditrichota bacterium]